MPSACTHLLGRVQAADLQCQQGDMWVRLICYLPHAWLPTSKAVLLCSPLTPAAGYSKKVKGKTAEERLDMRAAMKVRGR